MDDEMIKAKIAKHDQKAFSQIVDAYSKLLWAVAGGIICPTGSAEDIEECVSDALMELWLHPNKYDPNRGSIKSYLCIIAKSRALNILRKKSKDNTIPIDVGAQELSVDDGLDIDDYSVLYGAIKKVKEPTKEILIRRYFNDEKTLEIAKKMGIPKKEVENRLYRGRQALKSMLTEKQEVQ